ncbi:MAG: hypothetical protein AAF620_07440 [Bacteroidota bacterium]
MNVYLIESFAKLDFWFKSRLSEFQKRSLLIVNEAFEILSNEELGQKAGFSKILIYEMGIKHEGEFIPTSG